MTALWVVLGLLVLAGLWFALSPARLPVPAALALVVCSAAWLRIDQRREGRVLLVFSAQHGLTQADLAVPLVVLVAAELRFVIRLVVRRRSRHGRQRFHAGLRDVP